MCKDDYMEGSADVRSHSAFTQNRGVLQTSSLFLLIPLTCKSPAGQNFVSHSTLPLLVEFVLGEERKVLVLASFTERDHELRNQPNTWFSPDWLGLLILCSYPASDLFSQGWKDDPWGDFTDRERDGALMAWAGTESLITNLWPLWPLCSACLSLGIDPSHN